MVVVLISLRPSFHIRFCRVESDQVAVPSFRRSGSCWATATILPRASVSYVGFRPRPALIERAARPCWLKRSTSPATVLPLRSSAACAACRNGCPCTTASRARARRTRSTRSLLARAIPSRAACSCSVTVRNGSFCGVPMAAALPSSTTVCRSGAVSTSYLRRDPLVHDHRENDMAATG